MKTKIIKIKDIVIDAGTQQRVTINNDVVAEYAEAIKCGAQFPPITVFFNGVDYYLVDGFHRHNANIDAKIDDILANIIDGTRREAVLYSLGVNHTHGIRLTNSDKRKAVLTMLNDDEWRYWTDILIAKHCHVTSQFVGKIRRENDNNNHSKNETVSFLPLETAKTLENKNEKNENLCGEDENDSYDERDCEIDNLRDQNDLLKEKVLILSDALATGQLPEDEIISAEQTIIDLRNRVKALEAELDAVKSSRDIYQTENAQLKDQCERFQRQLKKLGEKNNA